MNVKRKIVNPMLMWLLIITGVYIEFQFVEERFIFRQNIYTSFLIFPALAYWFYFFIGAIKVHRKAASSADNINQIIKKGVYSKVRHPIYSADIILACSIFLYYPDLRFFIGAILLVLVMIFWIHIEEKILIEKFRDQYIDYQKNTPKIFPKFIKNK